MAFGRGAAPFTTHRMPLYVLLWLTSAALLGLTAFRIHQTRSIAHFFDSIIAELLATSIITLLWIPYAIMKLMAQRNTVGGTTGTGTGARHPGLRNELGGNTVLWILWLVGAAVTTHKWPRRSFCGTGTRMQCTILMAIEALAWVGWSLLTLIKILTLMQHAAGAGYASGGHVGEGHGTRGFGDKNRTGAGVGAGGVGPTGTGANTTGTGAGYA